MKERKRRIDKYRAKRCRRVWGKKINYGCRKRVADQRQRVKGRFISRTEAFSVKAEDGKEDKGNAQLEEKPKNPESSESPLVPSTGSSIVLGAADSAKNTKNKKVVKPIFKVIKASPCSSNVPQ